MYRTFCTYIKYIHRECTSLYSTASVYPFSCNACVKKNIPAKQIEQVSEDQQLSSNIRGKIDRIRSPLFVAFFLFSKYIDIFCFCCKGEEGFIVNLTFERDAT
jgi:hypothetical protein